MNFDDDCIYYNDETTLCMKKEYVRMEDWEKCQCVEFNDKECPDRTSFKDVEKLQKAVNRTHRKLSTVNKKTWGLNTTLQEMRDYLQPLVKEED